VKCAVCSRQPCGFSWFNPRLRPNDPARESDRWRFCSKRCLDAFARLMAKTGGHMVDPTEMEIAALRACLRPLGEVVAEIGMQRPLADYTQAEILTVIEAVVTGYQDFMLAEHERLAAQERAALEPYLLRALAPPPSQGSR
jgi:hypothetical protein